MTALLRGWLGRRLEAPPIVDPVHGENHEVIDDGGGDDERPDGIDEVTVEERVLIDGELELGEVRLAAERGKQRG